MRLRACVSVNFEDAAKALSVASKKKYSPSELILAEILKTLPWCDAPATHHLLRRSEVNELPGNADMHLKRLDLIYRDAQAAALAPGYDIFSTHVYLGAQGLALAPLQRARRSREHQKAWRLHSFRPNRGQIAPVWRSKSGSRPVDASFLGTICALSISVGPMKARKGRWCRQRLE